MKRLTLLVIAAALAWSAYWGWSAWMQRSAIEAWFEGQRADGWAASYEDLAVRGFPNRIDTTFTGLVLADPETETVWEAPLLQVLQVVYNRDHVIVAFPETQVLTRDGARHEITAEGLRASLVRDGDLLLRANAEAGVLNISGEAPLALRDLTAAISRTEDNDRRYRIAVNAEGIATGGAALPGGSEDGLELDAHVTLAEPLSLGAAGEPRPTRIEIARAEIGKDALRLAATGEMDVDEDGYPEGQLSLRVENVAEAIEAERRAGRVPEELLALIEGGAQLIAGLSGRRDTIDVTFEFRDRRTWLGILPLGPAPQLH